MIYTDLSEDDLHTITEGCFSERLDLVARIRKQQKYMDAISRDINAEIGSGMTREERGGIP